MAINLNEFTELYTKLCNIPFFGTESGVRPPLMSSSQVGKAMSSGEPFLPLRYRNEYSSKVDQGLPILLTKLKDAKPADRLAVLEQFCAPVYEHAPHLSATDMRPELNRFLAVISNLYRSFVDRKKRTSINVPIVTDTPPMAFFQTDGNQGPYTITSETMLKQFNTPVGIVSLPATYRNHPALWASLTHEVCGHDVVHADANLVPELVSGVRNMFTNGNFQSEGPLTGANLQAALWSYWIDEAVADVYGVLNMGPTFPLNLAAFFAALRARSLTDNGRPRPNQPLLSTDSGPRDPDNNDFGMDEHPTDILRLHLAIGVIESLVQLDSAKRNDYVASIQAVAQLAAGGATAVRLEGLVQISHDNFREVQASVPLAAAQDAARQVGKFIATATLDALDKHSIQDIETWSDPDEQTAAVIAELIGQNKPIVAAGDDAQLLAGATMALVTQPAIYDKTVLLLNDALDDSFKRDPIWGEAAPDLMYAPSRFKMSGGPKKPRGAGGGKKKRKGR